MVVRKKKVTKKKTTSKKKTVKVTAPKKVDLDHGHSKFDDKLIPVIKNLAHRGKTYSGIAELLSISEKTFYNWIKGSDALSKALEEAKGDPLKKVEAALIERALGYSCKETKTHITKSGVVKTKDIVKHYPPSETAIKYYLGNKDSKNWKDQQQINLGNGEDGEAFEFGFTLDKKPEHRDKGE